MAIINAGELPRDSRVSNSLNLIPDLPDRIALAQRCAGQGVKGVEKAVKVYRELREKLDAKSKYERENRKNGDPGRGKKCKPQRAYSLCVVFGEDEIRLADPVREAAEAACAVCPMSTMPMTESCPVCPAVVMVRRLATRTG